MLSILLYLYITMFIYAALRPVLASLFTVHFPPFYLLRHPSQITDKPLRMEKKPQDRLGKTSGVQGTNTTMANVPGKGSDASPPPRRDPSSSERGEQQESESSFAEQNQALRRDLERRSEETLYNAYSERMLEEMRVRRQEANRAPPREGGEQQQNQAHQGRAYSLLASGGQPHRPLQEILDEAMALLADPVPGSNEETVSVSSTSTADQGNESS